MDPRMLAQRDRVAAVHGEFIRRVYNWMGLGLALTAVVALYTASNHALLSLIFSNSLVFFGLIIGELALVLILSAAIGRMQSSTGVFLFFLYSALNGLTL